MIRNIYNKGISISSINHNKNNLSLGQKDVLNLGVFQTPNAINVGVVFLLDFNCLDGHVLGNCNQPNGLILK